MVCVQGQTGEVIMFFVFCCMCTHEKRVAVIAA